MKNGGTIYIFIGPPGSGKGTLAHECVKAFNWVTLSTGALCRQHICKRTEIGKQIDLIIKSGKLISDYLVTSMVDEWLAKQVCNTTGIVLDGYPRTEGQIDMLFGLLRAKYASFFLRVVKFEINDDSATRRLSGRLWCKNSDCQAVFSVLPDTGLEPEHDNVCDRCAGVLVQRVDDDPEVIRNRLAVYHQHDQSIFFERKGQRVEAIDVDRPLSEVFDVFKQLIKA